MMMDCARGASETSGRRETLSPNLAAMMQINLHSRASAYRPIGWRANKVGGG